MKQHLSDGQLNEFVDMASEERMEQPDYGHIAECERCRTRLEQLLQIHRSLQRQSVPAADPARVQHIMARVRTGGGESIVWPLVLRLAYFVAMLIVVGVVGFIFYQFNIIDFTSFDLQQDEASGIVADIYRTIQTQSLAMGKGIIDFYDRLFGIESYSIFTFTILLLVVLALIDKWLLEPMIRRRY
jgi:hypothetical protein